jgi:pSer/pThr/pTyr-binding forkhead associated (FHA) protein
MDAKANTLICDSPIGQEALERALCVPQSAYLIVVGGGIPGSMLRVDERRTSVGRSGENSFQFTDLTLSRRHASFWLDTGGAVCVEDEGSTNGTFLNGHRVAPGRVKQLQDGDRIQLGQGIVLKLVRLDPSDELFQR